jgi:hypothetical protein
MVALLVPTSSAAMFPLALPVLALLAAGLLFTRRLVQA